ncbi:ChbG/HpnK family deacetylase [Enterococcus gallinarum]|uniref:ChbG/HpnK family deacetylase n=1 Tax=Enterococcus gallinarum TaxID=1353 RepID=UPI003D6BEBF9
MKLLIQSDDYGLTRSVSQGIIHGIRHGILRNTGMFVNMPWTEECFQLIEPYLDRISLGIDLNVTTGHPIARKHEIPNLLTEQGKFYSSSERKLLLSTEHTVEQRFYEEFYKEFDAQIQKFIQLTGKKPDYIHPHAFITREIIQVQRDLAKKYGVVYSLDMLKRIEGKNAFEMQSTWYIKPATYANQLKSSLKEYILMNEDQLLKKEYCILIGHMGYVDKDLMDLSTFNLYRINDLEAITSQEVIQWVRANNVDIITYSDLQIMD